MPRKPKKLTEKELKEVEGLAGLGLTQAQISGILCISIDTLRKYAIAYYRRGKCKAIANVCKTAYTMALSGKCPAMTIFFLKIQAGWREKTPPLPTALLRLINGKENSSDEC
jgi:hypothetical protein